MPGKWPVNEQSSPDDIFLRHRAPVAAIVTIITVVAHGEVTVGRDDERAFRGAEQGLTLGITFVEFNRGHHPPNPIALGQLAIDIKIGRIDPQFVARRASEPLDVVRRARFRILSNPKDMIGAKDKDVAAMRMNKVITELIDKDLIAGINRPARDDLAPAIDIAGIDLEVLAQNFRRRVDGEGLVIALDARDGEEEKKLPRSDAPDRVVRPGNDVDVVPARTTKSMTCFKMLGAGAVVGWPMIPLRVGCIEPVGILKGWMK